MPTIEELRAAAQEAERAADQACRAAEALDTTALHARIRLVTAEIEELVAEGWTHDLLHIPLVSVTTRQGRTEVWWLSGEDYTCRLPGASGDDGVLPPIFTTMRGAADHARKRLDETAQQGDQV